ncbi:MAG: hypothetical protein ACK4S6_18120 [Roseateles asaccharophilus]|uniref:Uncharacterized protein n=1 Tax=Roseateles asaccharophilus TaxID=582607 RepID=A0A4R6N995_9BURK|nr:hypothetical protein DFR39_102574 [Roseateles asaccharophilus]
MNPFMAPHQRRRMRIALSWLLVSLVLAAVFLAYAQPALMQQLSEQLWACF